MGETLTAVVATLAVVGAGIAGYYAWDGHSKYRAAAAHASAVDGNLATCSQELEDERSKRQGSEKLAAETAAHLDASSTELEALRAQRAEDDKRLAAFQAMTEKFRKMIDSGKLEVTIRHGRMIVKLPASVLFASGSADLSKDGKTALAEVASVLKQFPDRRFMVAGHTDNVPTLPTSPFKDNWQLSAARAVTVTEALVASGMNGAHLAAAGYNEYEPVRENGSEAGRQENRRIEIVLLPNLAELPPLPGQESPAKTLLVPPGPSAAGSVKQK
jgi:chemotaxis protein MotB